VDPLSNLPPELAPLWQAAHDRLSSGRPVSRVRFGPLDSLQQAALADLLGIGRMPGEYPTVSLSELDQILAESVGAGTREVVTRLIGPLGDRAGTVSARPQSAPRLPPPWQLSSARRAAAAALETGEHRHLVADERAQLPALRPRAPARSLGDRPHPRPGV
jgi:Protein of unknown function N-terminus (DUF3323)